MSIAFGASVSDYSEHLPLATPPGPTALSSRPTMSRPHCPVPMSSANASPKSASPLQAATCRRISRVSSTSHGRAGPTSRSTNVPQGPRRPPYANSVRGVIPSAWAPLRRSGTLWAGRRDDSCIASRSLARPARTTARARVNRSPPRPSRRGPGGFFASSRLPPGWNRRRRREAEATAAGVSPARLGGATACAAGRLNSYRNFEQSICP
jgi:hypothetical protein